MTLYYFTSEVAFPSLELFRSDQKVEKVASGGVGKPLRKPNRIDKAEKNERITTRYSAKVPIMGGVVGLKGTDLRSHTLLVLWSQLQSLGWIQNFFFSPQGFLVAAAALGWVEVGMENGKWSKRVPSQGVSLQGGVWFQRTKVHPTLLIRPGRPQATHDQLAGRTRLFNAFIHSIILSSRFGAPPQSVGSETPIRCASQ